jgi:hypothetical protein
MTFPAPSCLYVASVYNGSFPRSNLDLIGGSDYTANTPPSMTESHRSNLDRFPTILCIKIEEAGSDNIGPEPIHGTG